MIDFMIFQAACQPSGRSSCTCERKAPVPKRHPTLVPTLVLSVFGNVSYYVFVVYEVVLVPRCVCPYKYRKILRMVFELMALC